MAEHHRPRDSWCRGFGASPEPLNQNPNGASRITNLNRLTRAGRKPHETRRDRQGCKKRRRTTVSSQKIGCPRSALGPDRTPLPPHSWITQLRGHGKADLEIGVTVIVKPANPTAGRCRGRPRPYRYPVIGFPPSRYSTAAYFPTTARRLRRGAWQEGMDTGS